MTSRADSSPRAWPSLGTFPWRRSAAFFAITLLALFAFAAAFAAAYVGLHDGRIVPGVTVGGVRVAGLDRSAAERELRRSLPVMGSGRLTLAIGEERDVIRYSAIERDYAMTAMLDQALAVGRGGNPVGQLMDQLRTLFDGLAVPVGVTWDAERLAQRVAALAASVEADPVDAAINRPNGRFVVSPAADGLAVDEQALLGRAMSALADLSAADATARVEPTFLTPAISTGAAQTAADRATLIASAPLGLSAGDARATIDAATINGWLGLVPTPGVGWQTVIEERAVVQLVDRLKLDLDIKATNASYTFEDRELAVIPDADGLAIDGDAAVASIMGALEDRADGAGRPSVKLAMTAVAPEFTTTDARAIAPRVERLSRWTTTYASGVGNGFGVNIRRPTNLINGTVVQPGEVFDFVGVAGPITQDNGYTGGAAIIHGNTQLDGVLGGGLCSCSTTLFNAALRAGFEMGARRNHAYFIDRYPVGLDATIWINGSYVQTMSFTNDSQYPILIRGINRANSVEFQIWGVPDGRTVELSEARVWAEKEAWTRIEYSDELLPNRTKRIEYPFDGFSSSVTRIVRAADGSVLHEDTYRSNYRRVVGHVLVGWEEGDPPVGTIVENPPVKE